MTLQSPKPTDSQPAPKVQAAAADIFNASLFPKQILDIANQTAKLQPAFWHEAFSVMAEATEDYAALLRKLSKIDSPVDATALFGEYLQTAAKKNLDGFAKLATFSPLVPR